MVRWGYKPTNLQQTGLPLKKKTAHQATRCRPSTWPRPG